MSLARMKMTIDNNVKHVYFKWLASIAMPDENNYNQLLSTLFQMNFEPSMEEDNNRAIDGINFRKHFANVNHFPESIVDYYLMNEPCSLLEMMVALAFKMEECIMSDDNKGDRTHIWFKEMLNSLDLINQDDYNFVQDYVEYRINIFNTRSYCPNGYGGLFTIHDTNRDMREFEIWYQMNWYVNEVDRNLEHYNI